MASGAIERANNLARYHCYACGFWHPDLAGVANAPGATRMLDRGGDSDLDARELAAGRLMNCPHLTIVHRVCLVGAPIDPYL